MRTGGWVGVYDGRRTDGRFLRMMVTALGRGWDDGVKSLVAV
jgi:hypothetical protein